jgi:polysaccharide biosynthesis protein PslG
MPENQLTRREFLSITAAGTLITLLDSCGGGSTILTSKNTPTPQFIPGSITPKGLGVNIHFTAPQQNEVKRIYDAGFGFVRMDFPWSDIESEKKGGYDFSKQEQLVGELKKQRIFALGVLAYGNPLYDTIPAPPHTGPHTDEARQAFARFAKEAARRFNGQNRQGVIWEIWNEPNNPDFWKPKPNADDYYELAKVTANAIREGDPNNPNISIIAPAITTFPQYLDIWNFLERCFKRGLLEHIDAVSIHPYRYDIPPEMAVDDYNRLRTLIASHPTTNKKRIPIISSEWGYPITMKVSEVTQAEFLVRQFLINSMNEIPLSIWYDWHDDGPKPQVEDYTFGVLNWTYQSKSAYFAIQTLMQQLNGFHFNENLLPSKRDFVVPFTKGKSQTLVIWTVDDPHPVRLHVNAPSITIVSMTGARSSRTPTNGELVMELKRSPQYLLTVP